MTTITTKIAKNGAILYYVDGKRISRAKALEIAANNDREIMSSLFDEETDDVAITITVEFKTEFGEYLTDNYFFANVQSAISAAKKIVDTFGERIIKITIAETGDWYNRKVFAYVYGNGSIDYSNSIDAEQAVADNTEDETDGTEDDADESIFSLLPSLDELNDVDAEPKSFIEGPVTIITFTEAGTELSGTFIANEEICYCNGDFSSIVSEKYGAMWSEMFRNRDGGAWLVKVPDGKWSKWIRPDNEEFFAIMSERGACTIDPPRRSADRARDRRRHR